MEWAHGKKVFLVMLMLEPNGGKHLTVHRQHSANGYELLISYFSRFDCVEVAISFEVVTS
jgi:hypothetical protein